MNRFSYTSSLRLSLRSLLPALCLIAVAPACGDDSGTSGGTDSGTDSEGESSESGGDSDPSDGSASANNTTSGGTDPSGSESMSETGATSTGDPSATDDPGTTTGDPSTTTDDPSTTGDPSDTEGDTDGTTGGDDVGAVADCYTDKFDETVPLADYDQYDPVVGSHCLGTNHQEIIDVERVVFLGDSVTVGTPPTTSPNFYRTKVADALANKFNLEPASPLWKAINPIDGTALQKDSGAFSSCSEWGARTDDFPSQIASCFNGPETATTLVVTTMGGNDVASIAKDATNGDNPLSEEEIFARADEVVQYLDDALAYFADPINFPNGAYVVFANVYEYTDRTGDLGVCQAAQFQDLSGMWPEGMPYINYLNSEFMRLAVEYQTDMIFMSEEYCGHGFYFDDPSTVCYEPDAENWFDFTCIHPTPTGHENLAGMFMSVVDE